MTMNSTGKGQKIGILGGTFNPIHIGHLMLAENARQICGLDKVLIMPSGCSYFKDPDKVADTKHRVRMTELAIMENDKFELSTIESDRSGNSYTYETLEELCKLNPGTHYYYIIGADTLFSIETWKKPENIFDKCTIVCAGRYAYSEEELRQKSLDLKDRFNADVMIMDVPEVPVSSTMIRELMTKGLNCRYYLNDKVIEYIKENGLYKS